MQAKLPPARARAAKGARGPWYLLAALGLLAQAHCGDVPPRLQASTAQDGNGTPAALWGFGRSEASAAARDARMQALADKLLPEVAQATGLAVRAPVVAREVNKAQLRRLLEEDEQQARSESGRSVEAAPAYGHAQDAYLDLMVQNVRGLYDPRSKELVLIQGLREEERLRTMRHELTHALQDQHFDLVSLQLARKDSADASLALSAVLEGQAMAAMEAQGLELELPELPPTPGQREPTYQEETPGQWLMALRGAFTAAPATAGPGKVPGGASVCNAHLAASARVRGASRPLLAAAQAPGHAGLVAARGHEADEAQLAPVLFPYVHGKRFIDTLSWEQTLAATIAQTLTDVPLSTQQILHPAAYLRGVAPEVWLLPQLAQLPGHAPSKRGALGEFLLSCLLGYDAYAAGLAAGWQGDQLLTFENFVDSSAGILLTSWRTPAAARRFARAVRNGQMSQSLGISTDAATAPVTYVYGNYVAVFDDFTAEEMALLADAVEHDFVVQAANNRQDALVP